MKMSERYKRKYIYEYDEKETQTFLLDIKKTEQTLVYVLQELEKKHKINIRSVKVRREKNKIVFTEIIY
jgi:hypothetical protein